MWNLKNDTNEPIYKTRYKLLVHRGGRRGKSGIWEEHIHSTMGNIKQISSKVLPYSTGKYV